MLHQQGHYFSSTLKEATAGIKTWDQESIRRGLLFPWEFGVSLSLMYGEGDNAFERLQAEIGKNINLSQRINSS